MRIEDGRCRLVSRNGNEFKSFAVLTETLGLGRKLSYFIDEDRATLGATITSQS